jgi:hypothetical protein
MTFNGANAGTSFVDLSPVGHTVSIYSGTPTTTTAAAKFGSTGLNLPSSVSALSVPATKFQFATGSAWTVEFWISPTAFPSAYANVVSMGAPGAGVGNGTVRSGWAVGLSPTGLIDFAIGDVGLSLYNEAATVSSIPLNTWTHIAIVVNGSTVPIIYFNGVPQSATVSTGISWASVTPTELDASVFLIGQYYFNGGSAAIPLNAKLDDLRITTQARYAGQFIVSPIEIPTCQESYPFGNVSLSDSARAYFTTANSGGSGATLSPFGTTLTWVVPGAANFTYYRTGLPIRTKSYCEFTVVSGSTTTMTHGFGVQRAATNIFYNPAGGTMMSGNGGCGLQASGFYNEASPTSSASYSFTTGDRIGIAFDPATGKVWFRKNGTWISGDPATGTSPTMTLANKNDYYFTVGTYSCSIGSGTWVYQVFPSAVGQLYAAPTGFISYGDTDTVATVLSVHANSDNTTQTNLADIDLTGVDTDVVITNGGKDFLCPNNGLVPTTQYLLGKTSRMAGKYYFEILFTSVGTTFLAGLINSTSPNSLAGSIRLNPAIGTVIGYGMTGAARTTINTASQFVGSPGDIYMFAIDFVTCSYWVGKNGTWYLAGGNPSSGTTPSGILEQIIIGKPGVQALGTTGGGTSGGLRLGVADLTYPIPTGYSAWAATPDTIDTNGTYLLPDWSCAQPKIVTPQGNAQLSAVQTKYNNRSLYVPNILSQPCDHGAVVTNHQDFIFADGDFTIETWAYRLSNTNIGYLFQYSATNTFAFTVTTGGLITLYYSSSGGGQSVVTSQSFSLNTWHHVVIQRRSDVFECYFDGVNLDTTTITGGRNSIVTPTGPLYIGRATAASSSSWNGYIDEFHITKGQAVYANQSVPTSQFPTNSTADPYYNNVVLLLNMGGTNGSTALIDSSIYTRSPTTTVGPVSIDTSVSKYSGGAMNFTGGYFWYDDSPDFDVGSGDWTVEGWCLLNAAATTGANRSVLLGYQAETNGGLYPYTITVNTSSTLSVAGYNDADAFAFSVVTARTVVSGIWYHVALQRKGSVITLFMNGAVWASVAVTGTLKNSPRKLGIGIAGEYTSAGYSGMYGVRMMGWIDSYRFTKGIARYPGAFTPKSLQWCESRTPVLG